MAQTRRHPNETPLVSLAWPMIPLKLLGGFFIINMLDAPWDIINHMHNIDDFQTVHKLELGEGVVAHAH